MRLSSRSNSPSFQSILERRILERRVNGICLPCWALFCSRGSFTLATMMYTPQSGDSAQVGSTDAQAPDLRKPSQTYVNSYIARRADPASPAPSCLSPTPSSAPRGRSKRIFYQLEEACPAHYYPKLKEVDPHTMLLLRRLLVAMCMLQVGSARAVGQGHARGRAVSP